MAMLTVHPQAHLGNSSKLSLRGSMENKRVRLRGSAKKDQLDDSSLTPSSEDPLRILAPGQKKLSTIESQRVLAAMEEAIKRLSNATLIPLLASSLDRYSVSLGAELVAMLKEYSHLAGEYNRLYLDLKQKGSAPNLDDSNESADAYGSGIEVGATSGGSVASVGSFTRPVRLEPLEREEGEEEPQVMENKFQQVRFRLKHVVKCILRALHRNPSASSLLPAGSSAAITPKNVIFLQEEMR